MAGLQVDEEMIPLEDDVAFVTSWATGQISQIVHEELSVEAASVCQRIFHAEAFRSCRRSLSIVPYIKACELGLLSSNADSHCDAASSYAAECARNGHEVNQWWTDQMCPKSCPNNQIFQQFSADCEQTCSGQVFGHCDVFSDGCSCPTGTVYQDIAGTGSYGQCVFSFDCPCVHENQVFVSGEFFSSKCETCQCQNGAWSCHSESCPGECRIDSAIGVHQFDGQPIRVENDCSYVLAKTDSWQVVGHFEKAKLRYIDLDFNGQKVSIDGQMVHVNGEEAALPVVNTLLTVDGDRVSSVVLQSVFGLSVVSTPDFVNIVADHKWQNKTSGLCGIYNGDSSDDLKVHFEDSLPQKVSSKFTSSWAMSSECSSKQKHRVIGQSARHFCIEQFLNAPVFEECQDFIDFEHFAFICEGRSLGDSVCDVFDSALAVCEQHLASANVFDWRNQTGCEKHCPKGQSWTHCGCPTDSSCPSVSSGATCETCVPGCYCTEGTVKNSRGECVAQSDCECITSTGHVVPANEYIHEENQTCHCSKGRLSCKTNNEKADECPAGAMISEEAQTCPNQAESCGCAAPLYYDARTKSCVKLAECSCTDSGRLYKSSDEIVNLQGRNKISPCTCFAGEWTCGQDIATPRQCRFWGGRNFVTFDGHTFSWDPSCEVTLAKTADLTVNLVDQGKLALQHFTETILFTDQVIKKLPMVGKMHVFDFDGKNKIMFDDNKLAVIQLRKV